MKDRAFVSAANGAWAIVVSIALLGGFGCGSKTDSRAIYARLKNMPVNTPDGSYRLSGKGVRSAGRQMETMTMGVNRVYQGNSGDLMEPSAWSGGVAPAGTTLALSTFTASGVIADEETIQVAGRTYTFKVSILQTDGQVKIGVDEDETLANLQAAINLEAGAGTKYGSLMTIHPKVSVVATANAIIATALHYGAGENSLTCTDGVANGSWSDATLVGGVTNWDTDDEIIFDGDITQEPPLLNTNLRGVEIAGIRVKRTFMVDIGTEANPLAIHVEDTAANGRQGVVQYRGEGTLYFSGRWDSTQNNRNNIFCDSINTKNAIVLVSPPSLGSQSFGNVEVKNGKVHIRSGTTCYLGASLFTRYLVTGSNSHLVLDTGAATANIAVVDLGGTLTYGPDIVKPVFVSNGSTLFIKNQIFENIVISANSRVFFDYEGATPSLGSRKLLVLGRGDYSKLNFGGFTTVIGPNGTLDAGPVASTDIIDLRKDFPYGG